MCYIQNFQQMSSGKLFGRLKWKLFYSFAYCMCCQQLQCATVKCDTKTTCCRVTERHEKGFAPGFSLCQNLRILVPQISRLPWQVMGEWWLEYWGHWQGWGDLGVVLSYRWLSSFFQKNFPELFQPEVKGWKQFSSCFLLHCNNQLPHLRWGTGRFLHHSGVWRITFNGTQGTCTWQAFSCQTLYTQVHSAWSTALPPHKGLPTRVASLLLQHWKKGAFKSSPCLLRGGPSSSSHLFKSLLRGNQDSDDINKRE